MKVDLIAGARPNFMKIAPIIDAIHSAKNKGKIIDYRLVHTGQHYDKNMSESFFEQLGIPHPHVNLGAGGGTQAEQTASIMVGYEKLLNVNKPDICIVVGDVTSTMACSIVAQKAGVKVAHIEGGIRSGDWTMPEEINRIVTDSITNFFFTTSHIANDNLKRSGIEDRNIFWVGNTMIDTLLKYQEHFIKPKIFDEIKLTHGQYVVMTLHRPANVDEESKFRTILNNILLGVNNWPIIFPVHPRTSKLISQVMSNINTNLLHLVEPLSYLEFNYLVKHSGLVITDSGGITEETTVMGIPCMTLRDNTERPETVTIGTNQLVGTNPENILTCLNEFKSGKRKQGAIPEKWDGKSSERIVEILLNLFD
ncbi:MAG: UDP-N-acetylglucosamine 2-epimerase (non-hydrolyzing) [Bacteroidia bacterium]|nr:UDP-N-acetylglucosamine 2-epimerase (non-hydrolyzing) [Bacteroidia bacterium]